jgi:hypothetical protein
MLEKAVGVLTLCAVARIRIHDQLELRQLFTKISALIARHQRPCCREQ